MRPIFLWFLFSLSSYYGFCQTIKKSHNSLLGLRVGYTNSTIKGTDVDLFETDGDLRPGNGILVGLLSRTNFKNKMVFQTELTLIKKGGKFIHQLSFYEKPDKSVRYLQLPLILGYNVSDHKKQDLTIEAGTAFHYAVPPYRSNVSTQVGKRGLFCPLAGLTWIAKSAHVNYLIALRYDFDYQKYLDRMAGTTEYYIQHSGTLSLSTGILF